MDPAYSGPAFALPWGFRGQAPFTYGLLVPREGLWPRVQLEVKGLSWALLPAHHLGFWLSLKSNSVSRPNSAGPLRAGSAATLSRPGVQEVGLPGQETGSSGAQDQAARSGATQRAAAGERLRRRRLGARGGARAAPEGAGLRGACAVRGAGAGRPSADRRRRLRWDNRWRRRRLRREDRRRVGSRRARRGGRAPWRPPSARNAGR